MQMRTILNNTMSNAPISHQNDAASKHGDPKAKANPIALLGVRPPKQIQYCVPSR
jgi:hypothetical protein